MPIVAALFNAILSLYAKFKAQHDYPASFVLIAARGRIG
jgi:hypothetical protein